MSNVIYIKPELQKTLYRKEVFLSDVCQVECSDKKLKDSITSRKLYEFPAESEKKVCKKVFSILDIVKNLQELIPEENLIFVGESDFLVEYQKGKECGAWLTKIKTLLVCVLVFFGSAFTIMSFNNDISINGVFEHFYYQMTGLHKPDFSELEVAYSIGLAVGIIVFFNHFGSRRLTDDVTPIEVEMNKHKKDTYETIIAQDGQK